MAAEVKTIRDFEAGRLYTVRQVATVLRYEPATIRRMIRSEEQHAGCGIKAVRMPFSGVRIRRPKQPYGRPNYRIDGAEVLRLWGQMKLEAAALVDATPQPAASEANRVKSAFDRLAKIGRVGGKAK